MNSVTKTCRLCAVIKPTSDFHPRKDSADGFRNDCRSCVSSRGRRYYQDTQPERIAAAKARYDSDPEAINARRRSNRSHMTAEQRKAELERNRTWVANNQDRVRETRKAYLEANTERTRARNQSWHERNREYVREYKRKHWAKNAAALKQQGASYRIANRDRLAAQQRAYYRANKQRIHAYQAAYRATNGETVNKLSRVRYLRSKSGKFSTPDPQMLAAKWRYWGEKCWMCGGIANTIDHVKPLSKGGSHLLANLRPACKSCNSSKHARWSGASKLSLFMRA